MKRLLVAACLAITFSFSASSMMKVPAAHAMNVVNQTNVPISGQIFNPCDGQVYDFSGYLHVMTDVTGDLAGGFHLVEQDNTQGIKLYNDATEQQFGVGNETDQFTLNLTPGASTFTILQHFTEISQGSAPNFVVEFLLHGTVNADGTVTAYVDNFRASCQG